MPDPGQTTAPGKVMTWAGWTLSAVVVAFLLFDTVIKLLRLPVVLQTLAQLGYPETVAWGIGAIELVCLALYVIPRTSVLGAVLLTALFGGGIASHVRLEHPLFSHVLFGVYLGLFVWGGLFLRQEGLRAIFPVRR